MDWLRRCFYAGRTMRNGGLGVCWCPFVEEGPLRDEWLRGWQVRDDELRRAYGGGSSASPPPKSDDDVPY